MSADLAILTDETLLKYYGTLIDQLASDLRSDYRFTGEAAKERKNAMLAEIQRRELSAGTT
jgi:hypothetical protein